MGAGAVTSRAVGQGGDAQASRGALNEEMIRGPSLMGAAAVAAEGAEVEAALAEAVAEVATAEAAAEAARAGVEAATAEANRSVVAAQAGAAAGLGVRPYTEGGPGAGQQGVGSSRGAPCRALRDTSKANTHSSRQKRKEISTLQGLERSAEPEAEAKRVFVSFPRTSETSRGPRPPPRAAREAPPQPPHPRRSRCGRRGSDLGRDFFFSVVRGSFVVKLLLFRHSPRTVDAATLETQPRTPVPIDRSDQI